MTDKKNKLIHVAAIIEKGSGKTYLLLRQVDPQNFIWFKQTPFSTLEEETSVKADQPEEALRLAARHWKDNHFRTIKCGFRYSLPERDEHGINALFHQMAASYNSSSGVYFDESAGNNCIVHHASMEARELLKQLQSRL